MSLLRGKLVVWITQVLQMLFGLTLVVLLPNVKGFNYGDWLMIMVLIQFVPVANFGYSETASRYFSLIKTNKIPKGYPQYVGSLTERHIRGYVLSEIVYGILVALLVTVLVGYFIDTSLSYLSFFVLLFRGLGHYLNHVGLNIAGALGKIALYRLLELLTIIVKIALILSFKDNLTVNLLFTIEALSLGLLFIAFVLYLVGFGKIDWFQVKRTDSIVLQLGLMVFFGYAISYVSSYGLSALNSPIIISYLFTTRFITALRTLVSVLLVPKVAEMNRHLALEESYKLHFGMIREVLRLALMLIFLFLGFVAITKTIHFGNLYFNWLSWKWIVFLSLKFILDVHQGVTSQLSFTKNSIPYVGVVLLSLCFVLIATILAVYQKNSVMAIISVPAALLLTSYWYIPYYFSTKVLKVRFQDYLVNLLRD